MARLVTVASLLTGSALRGSLAVVVVCVAGSAPASAQFSNVPFHPETQIAAAAHGELLGVVSDDRGEPLAGAVVSALGSTTAFAVTDRTGRFSFRTLPPGPYLVRAHLQGYSPARGHLIQVNSASRATSSILLARRGSASQPPRVVAAGAAGVEQPASEADTDNHDHSETAWRLRHLKRSVLKDAGQGVLSGVDDDDPFWIDSLETIGRAMGTSARFATSVLSDLPLTGQVNLLTMSSFDRPQELFSINAGPPRGVTFVSVGAPTGAGDWTVHGAMTNGDLASWILAGSFARRAPASHQYEAGMSYSMQRYQGGNPMALVAVADGSRNAGSVHAFDRWQIVPELAVMYGARYARYDYLENDGLLSPRLSLMVTPVPELRVYASATHREVAPGAEEFMPPGDLGVWLPPGRTFSPMSARHGFRPERMDHYEVGGEHNLPAELVLGMRAFRQRVQDQMITLFGVSLPESAAADIGHYFVASGGDVDARGWGVRLSRPIGGRFRGSVDYTQTNAEWTSQSPDVRALSLVARSALRTDIERVHDLTTSVHTEVPVTATRVFVLYKLNSAFAASEPTRPARLGTRFDVQVNQALPFLNFTSAQWEMLVAVRNVFREDVLEASIYDELLVVKPPKRIVGGLTVRF